MRKNEKVDHIGDYIAIADCCIVRLLFKQEEHQREAGADAPGEHSA